VKTYRDLVAWQKSMVLVTEVYEISKKFPKDELYGLTSQIRRCAISLPSNMAEGYGRNQLMIIFISCALQAAHSMNCRPV